jgi:enoyl-CoA hydratase/carnithine racemase
VDHFFRTQSTGGCVVLEITSADGGNKLSRARVTALLDEITRLQTSAMLKALIITGNDRFFSVGADLNEIAELTGPEAFEFSRLGQRLTHTIARFPAPVIAAIQGYCMGGALDVVLACHARIAAPNAVFGHRGAALGVMTGWGGTQRLPRLIGRARALEIFITAETVPASRALEIGLVNAVVEEPLQQALRNAASFPHFSQAPIRGFSSNSVRFYR